MFDESINFFSLFRQGKVLSQDERERDTHTHRVHLTKTEEKKEGPLPKAVCVGKERRRRGLFEEGKRKRKKRRMV